MRSIFILLLAILILGGLLMLFGSWCHDPSHFWEQTNAAWWQAVGSILAVASGFAVAFLQAAHAREEAKRARDDAATDACLLAQKTLEQVADRLFVAAMPRSGKQVGLALREHRTTEMINALRETDVRKLPPGIVHTFAALRSDLFAINTRITEIYRSEEERGREESERPRRLRSSLVIYGLAREGYLALAGHVGADKARNELQEPSGLDALIKQAAAAQTNRRKDAGSAVFPEFSDT